MTCTRCQEARTALADAARASLRGDLRTATTRTADAARHVAVKAQDEAARVRAMLVRR